MENVLVAGRGKNLLAMQKIIGTVERNPGRTFVAFLVLHAAVWIAACINVVVGFGAIVAHRMNPDSTETAQSRIAISATRPILGMPFVTTIAMLGGFISLSYEIFLFRTISFATGSSSLAFALTLGAFLIGIAVGARNAAEACGQLEPAEAMRKATTAKRSGVSVRRSRPTDLDRLSDLEIQVFATNRMSRRSLKRLLAAPSAAILIAEKAPFAPPGDYRRSLDRVPHVGVDDELAIFIGRDERGEFQIQIERGLVLGFFESITGRLELIVGVNVGHFREAVNDDEIEAAFQHLAQNRFTLARQLLRTLALDDL